MPRGFGRLSIETRRRRDWRGENLTARPPCHPKSPTVETERLIMRDHRLADFDAYVAMWADPIVTRFIGGRPRTREESLDPLPSPCRHVAAYGLRLLGDRGKGERPLRRRGRLPRIAGATSSPASKGRSRPAGVSSPTRMARALPPKRSARLGWGTPIAGQADDLHHRSGQPRVDTRRRKAGFPRARHGPSITASRRSSSIAGPGSARSLRPSAAWSCGDRAGSCRTRRSA